jgi:hypothetical protein
VKAILVAILLPCGVAAAVYYFFLTPEVRHERAVRQLIEATAIDEWELGTFTLIFKHSLERGDVTDAQYRCIVDVTRTDFTKLLAPGIRQNLSLAEAKQAAEHYRSALGAKALKGLHFELAKQMPDYPIRVTEEPAFDIDEFEALSKWRHSNAGEKAWDIWTLSEYAVPALHANIRDRKAACKARFP